METYKLSLLDSLNQLFLTENIFSYLLLMIFALLIFVVGTRVKYGALVAVPVGLLTGVYWLTNGLGWHFIILLFSSVGVMFLVATGKGR
jgi:hypothetical protein